MDIEDENQRRNREHYDKLYANYPVKNILYWLDNLQDFLTNSTSTETSWFALYKDDFSERIKGKRVLEMGCGDCVNASVMAALGAEVFANDIAPSSGEIIREVNKNSNFNFPIKFIEGDFLKNCLPEKDFDFIVGKSFLHHLTIPVEKEFFKESARLLKEDGEARFFEPAVNSKVLDELRWYTPVKGRPSKLSRIAFANWKLNDPHPERNLSSNHFINAGKEFFNTVHITPIGTLERFSKLMKWGKRKNDFKRWALKNEQLLPSRLNRKFTKSQLIVFSNPL